MFVIAIWGEGGIQLKQDKNLIKLISNLFF